jgi:hypothetical protein
MPQLSRVAVISGDSKKKKVPIIGMNASPAINGATDIDFRVLNGVLSIPSGTYNVTPNTTFSANILVWGAGGGPTPSFSGGAGGFATGTLTFYSGVSYNIVVGATGSSPFNGGGGAGSAIEYLANANVIIAAGGGGGAGTGGNGGAGGGFVAANGYPAGAVGASAVGAVSPGSLKSGGPGTPVASGFGFGGAGPGGGGGGLYGGAASASGGGGGGGYIESRVVINGNLITGTNTTPAFSTDSLRSNNAGQGGSTSTGLGNNGLIVISVL